MFYKIIQYIQSLFSKKEKLEISFSKFKTYRECPYRYSLIYVKGLKSAPSAYSSLGHSIHKALELYYNRKGSTLDDLLTAYQDGWEHEGFEDSAQAMEFYQRGEEMLKKYFEKEGAKEHEVLFSEKKFNMDAGFCFLRGVIDRIDRLPDGTVELVEYKTHKNAWRKKAVREDAQLTLYNYACREALGLKPDKLSYYFLSKEKKVSTERNKKDEKKLFKELKRVCRNIQNNNFKASTRFCFRCDFKERCVHAEKKN